MIFIPVILVGLLTAGIAGGVLFVVGFQIASWVFMIVLMLTLGTWDLHRRDVAARPRNIESADWLDERCPGAGEGYLRTVVNRHELRAIRRIRKRRDRATKKSSSSTSSARR